MATDQPTCFWCLYKRRMLAEARMRPSAAVFESLCGHEECPTMAFHGICLMEFREDAAWVDARQRNNAMIAWLRGEHGEG